ncbi:hypothetical protein WK24_15915 [Burkholderia vietnamiensis]|nr:hypothetical protein WK24_15915 [Burkholderia vietnamiensis]
MRIERDVLELNHYDRLAPTAPPCTGDEQREMNVLTAPQDKLAGPVRRAVGGRRNAWEECERIETELDIVTAAIRVAEMHTPAWSTQQMGEAGAFIIVDSQGDLAIECGLARHDRNAARDTGAATIGQTPTQEPNPILFIGHAHLGKH